MSGMSRVELLDCIGDIQQERDQALARIAELERLLNTPETADFDKGVPLEAAHQIGRWGPEHDAGKTPADWFWLVGYLAGKCLASHIAGNQEKALHHTISTAAVLRNWHNAIATGSSVMRPEISAEKATAFVKPATDAASASTPAERAQP